MLTNHQTEPEHALPEHVAAQTDTQRLRHQCHSTPAPVPRRHSTGATAAWHRCYKPLAPVLQQTATRIKLSGRSTVQNDVSLVEPCPRIQVEVATRQRKGSTPPTAPAPLAMGHRAPQAPHRYTAVEAHAEA